MTPTANLRFIERKVPMDPFYKAVDIRGNLVPAMQTYRILQQWWEMKEFICDEMRVTGGEWRDVPLEQEQA
jgi:hypothetical protein